ncbi:U32 family peptidase [Clostridium sediminicola]|uniref:peptidase U32 family protein n=1 Tax=Clostridium sediminicola TaxID=3114879 RepID=UPI0031F24B4A
MNKPELLAPAGNLEKLITAIDFGADAVYVGGNRLNLRAFANNFSVNDLELGLKYAHERGKKVYVTVNVFPHNEDLEGIDDYLIELYNLGVDAIIVSDPGIIMTAKEVTPNLEIHLSTQANNVNWKSANFWHDLGVKRIVLARELSLEEIKTIRKKTSPTCGLEAFIHGSMCMSYSGRCLLSNYMTGRDANRGMCAQPCRYEYYLMEEKRPGEYFPVFEDERGTYIMNSKDLCMIRHIPELVQSGIDSFKVEGRMKSVFYVATVIKAYRQAIDTYFSDPNNYKFDEKWFDYLLKPSHRNYTTGFYFDEENKQFYGSSSYVRDYDVIGIVKEFDKENSIVIIEQRNRVFDGETVGILRPEGDSLSVTLNELTNEEGKKIDAARNAKMIFKAKVDLPLKKNDLLFIERRK